MAWSHAKQNYLPLQQQVSLVLILHLSCQLAPK